MENIENALLNLWVEIFNNQNIKRTDNFFDVGGDIALSNLLVDKINTTFSISISALEIFEYATIEELSFYIQEVLNTKPAPMVMLAEGVDENDHQDVEVSRGEIFYPHQKYFILSKHNDIHYNNFSRIFKVIKPFDDSCLHSIIGYLLNHHEVFQSKVKYTSDTWSIRQEEIESEEIDNLFLKIDLDEFEESEHDACIEFFCSKVQASLDVINKQLIKIIYFKASKESRLFIVVHKSIFDEQSWSIFARDFDTLFTQFQNNDPLYLSKNNDFSYWNFSSEYVKSISSNELFANKKYWLNQLKNPESGLIPMDNPNYLTDLNTDSQKEVITFSKEDTRKFLSIDLFRSDEILLTVLLRFFEKVNKKAYARFVLCEDYRKEGYTGVSNIIGCFEYCYPVTLHSPRHSSWIDLLKHVKQQTRMNRLNSKGYGILKHVSQDADLERICIHEYSWMFFKYVGDKKINNNDIQNSFFSGIDFSIHKGPDKHPESLREYCIAFEGCILDDLLQVEIDFNPKQYNKETIENFASLIKETTEELINFCSNTAFSTLTPIDFPYVTISQMQLDNLEYKFPGLQQISPVSAIQKNFIFHTYRTLEPNGSQFTVTINEKIDSIKWEKIWTKAIETFPVLRSLFEGSTIEDLIQVVLNKIHGNFIYKELENNEEKINDYLKELAAKDFYIDAPPLFDVHLIKLQEEKYLFILNFYKVLLDETSLRQVWKYVLMQLDSDAKELKVTTYNFVAADESYHINDAFAFWNKRLYNIEEDAFFDVADACKVDINNIVEPIFKEQTFSITSKTKRALQFLSAEGSMQAVFQSIWAYLLHAYTAETYIYLNALGSVRSINANSNVTEDLVGMHSCFFPVVTDFEELNRTVLDYIKQTDHLWQEGLEYNSFLPDEIEKKAIYNENPLFDSVLNILVNGSEKEKFNSFIKTENCIFNIKTKHKLLIQYSNLNSNIIYIRYDSNSFSENQISELFADLEYMIDLFASNLPNKLISLKSLFNKQFSYSAHFLTTSKNKSDLNDLLAHEKKTFPLNETEKTVLEIWQQVLGIDTIGAFDSFFELGGDSLKATNVFSKLKDSGYQVTILDILESKTILDVCDKLQVKKDVVVFNKKPDMKNIGYLMPYHFACFYGLKDKAWNISEVYFSEMRFNESVLQQTLVEIYKYHDALRIHFDGDIESDFYRGMKMYNRSADEVLPTLIVHDWSDMDTTLFLHKVQETMYTIEIQNTYKKDNLAGFCIFRGKDGDHFHIMISHLICDGVSFKILVEDIFNWYKILLTGNTINFKRKTDSFVVASVKNYEYANTNEILNEIPYWADVYSSFKNNLLFPTDYIIEDSDKLFKNDSNLFVDLITNDALHKLERICLSNEISIVDLLMVTWGNAIKKWSSIEIFGTMFVNSGRQYSYSDIDVSRTLGCFVFGNYMKIDCTGNDLSIIEQAIRNKKNRDMAPHGGIGSSLLLELGYYKMLDYGHPLLEKMNSIFDTTLPYTSFNYLNFMGVSNDNESVNEIPFSPSKTHVRNIDSEASALDFFEVEFMHYKDRLSLKWRFNKLEFRHETIQDMINNMKNILNELNDKKY